MGNEKIDKNPSQDGGPLSPKERIALHKKLDAAKESMRFSSSPWNERNAIGRLQEELGIKES